MSAESFDQLDLALQLVQAAGVLGLVVGLVLLIVTAR